jgi:hypothetical protein
MDFRAAMRPAVDGGNFIPRHRTAIFGCRLVAAFRVLAADRTAPPNELWPAAYAGKVASKSEEPLAISSDRSGRIAES